LVRVVLLVTPAIPVPAVEAQAEPPQSVVPISLHTQQVAVLVVYGKVQAETLEVVMALHM
jgi:hypothetical protein